MRVVLASRVFAPDANAAAFRLDALVRALADGGDQVTVVTVKPSKAGRGESDYAAAHVNRWPVLRDKGGNVRGYIQYLSYDVPLFFRLFWRRADVFISEAPPTTGFVVAVVSVLRRKPFVYYAADLFSDGVVAVGAPKLVARIMHAVEGWVLRRARTVLAVSDDVAQKVTAFGVDVENIVTVGNGINTSTFSVNVAPAETGYPYFVYTGTMSEVHRPHVFVEAFAQIAHEFPAARMHFFGQGVYKDELASLATRLIPGRVEFADIIPADDVATWIRGASAALVSLTPDIGYDYAHPTKAYAAAAVGTPILYAGPEEFGRIVRDAQLGHAHAHDVVAVAEAMRLLLSEPTTKESRRARAAWIEANASLSEVARRAAYAVLRSRGRKESSNTLASISVDRKDRNTPS